MEFLSRYDRQINSHHVSPLTFQVPGVRGPTTTDPSFTHGPSPLFTLGRGVADGGPSRTVWRTETFSLTFRYKITLYKKIYIVTVT